MIKCRVLWGSLSLNTMPALEGGAVTDLVPMSKLRCREVKWHSERVEKLGEGTWVSLGWVCSVTGNQALTAPASSVRGAPPTRGPPRPILALPCSGVVRSLGRAGEGEGCSGLTTHTC